MYILKSTNKKIVKSFQLYFRRVEIYTHLKEDSQSSKLQRFITDFELNFTQILLNSFLKNAWLCSRGEKKSCSNVMI